jgi:O-antigen ligase
MKNILKVSSNSKRIFNNILTLGLSLILAGQFIFQILKHVLGLSGFAPIIVLSLIFICLIKLLRSKSANLKLNLIDLTLIIYIAFLILNNLLFFGVNFLELTYRIMFIFILPYAFGNILFRYTQNRLIDMLSALIIISLCCIIIFVISGSDIYREGRFILFALDDEDSTGGSTQGFLLHLFATHFFLVYFSHNKNKLWLVIDLMSMLLFCSRSAFVALILTFIILTIFKIRSKLFISIREKFYIIILFTLIMSILFVIGSDRIEFLMLFKNESNASSLARVLLMDSAIELIGDNPFLGVGAGNFSMYNNTSPYSFGSPHSSLLQVAVETGLLGLFFYILFALIAPLKIFFRNYEGIINKNIFESLIALILFNFIVMQISGNIYTDYHLNFFIGALSSMSRLHLRG